MSSTTSSSPISLSGIGSGIDWQSIVNQLKTADEASLSPYNSQIATDQSMISAWTTFAAQLTSLDTASQALESPTALDLYTATVTSSSTTAASSLLTASASTSASVGSYSVVINNTAQAEKIATSDFSSKSSALNISGTILVNGQAVQIAATDSMLDLQSKINNLDSGTSATGVTASIFQDSSSTYRLVLTSDNTGAAGISLANGSASDTLTSLGFNGTGTSIKNPTTQGAESDAFSSSSTAVEALLGNSDQNLSGNVTINGKTATIDLSDSLSAIQSTLSDAGISASIVSSTSGSNTTYNLAIEGMTSWTDQNNVLQALGLVTGGSVANTSGGSAITSSTLIKDIDGYQYTSGDEIAITGTTHNGTAVAATDFAITDTTTVGDLLNQIQSQFGNVTASVNSGGQIQVTDNATGTSKLSVNLSSSLSSSSGTLSFGSVGQYGTTHNYVLQQGSDASFSVDGMSMTSSTNTITSAIQGVTLNLLGADPNTTLTLNVNHDVAGIESEVNTMISAYNGVMSFVNTQMSYNASTSTTGGVLFGDNTLTSIKSQIQSTILEQVGTGTFQYLSQIGITQGGNAQISLDTSTFESALSTNFQGVADMFADSATTSDSQFQYVYSTNNTQSGTYNITVNTAVTGQDITGQIDGYDASGSGNILSLNNSASGANGLQVSYSGTTAPASATITVSRGIASLLDNLLQGFTDSANGTVTTQTNGLQTSIDGINKQITDMQNNINMQISDLTTEYENMNTYVAQMDSMQSYLTAQLSSLPAW
jgi:flagellar hook-associated protein 2